MLRGRRYVIYKKTIQFFNVTYFMPSFNNRPLINNHFPGIISSHLPHSPLTTHLTFPSRPAPTASSPTSAPAAAAPKPCSTSSPPTFSPLGTVSSTATTPTPAPTLMHHDHHDHHNGEKSCGRYSSSAPLLLGVRGGFCCRL